MRLFSLTFLSILLFVNKTIVNLSLICLLRVSNIRGVHNISYKLKRLDMKKRHVALVEKFRAISIHCARLFDGRDEVPPLPTEEETNGARSREHVAEEDERLAGKPVSERAKEKERERENPWTGFHVCDDCKHWDQFKLRCPQSRGRRVYFETDARERVQKGNRKVPARRRRGDWEGGGGAETCNVKLGESKRSFVRSFVIDLRVLFISLRA